MNDQKEINKVVLDILKTALEAPELEEGTEISANTISNWTSLKHLDIILAIEKKYGFEFTEDEIVEATDFISLSKCIMRHKQDAIDSMSG